LKSVYGHPLTTYDGFATTNLRGLVTFTFDLLTLKPSRITYISTLHVTVLGPILFIMYTTPLSTLILSQALNHHLYANDTQLFFSFYPPDLHSSISHLQTALQEISSKTEYQTQTITSQDTELLSQHHPLCSQSRLHL